MSKQADNGDVTKDSVMVALSKVQEPELHRDLVSLNMIRDLEISGGDVTFTVMLTTPACPLKHVMERDCRAAVMQISGVQQVTVNWDADVRSDSRIAGRLNLAVRNTIANVPPNLVCKYNPKMEGDITRSCVSRCVHEKGGVFWVFHQEPPLRSTPPCIKLPRNNCHFQPHPLAMC